MLTAHPKMTQFIISLHDMTDDILISGVEQKKSDLFKKLVTIGESSFLEICLLLIL